MTHRPSSSRRREKPPVTPPAPPVAPAGGVTPQLVRGGSVALNRGAPFAKRRFVQLTIESPAGATEALVANVASFASARRIVLSRSPQTVWWTLPVDGLARAPRRVYVRFVGQGLDPGYAVSDGIVLDRTAPRVGSVRVATAGRRQVALRVTGTDAVSGIDVVEWRASVSSPIRGVLYGERLLVPRALRSVFVRVVDRADNASTWRRVVLPGPDRD